MTLKINNLLPLNVIGEEKANKIGVFSLHLSGKSGTCDEFFNDENFNTLVYPSSSNDAALRVAAGSGIPPHTGGTHASFCCVFLAVWLLTA